MNSNPTLLFALLCCVGCADFSRGEPFGASGSGGGSMGAEAGLAISYAADIHALLQGGCASCHSPTGAASSTALLLTGNVTEDYLSALDLVDVGSPDASRLVLKMEGRGHSGGAIYTRASPQYARVLRWIGEGAAP